MQLIWYEIRKITSKRNLLVAILLLVFALFAFLYMEQLQSSEVLAEQKDVYFSIKTELEGKSLEDKKVWIEEKNSFFTQVQQYEEQLQLSEAFQDEEHTVPYVNAEFLSKYQELTQTDAYANRSAYLNVYHYLNTYYNHITGYETYLDGILEKRISLNITLCRSRYQRKRFNNWKQHKARMSAFAEHRSAMKDFLFLSNM